MTLESGEILYIQSVCRNLNKRFEILRPSEPRGLARQDSFLQRNLKAKEVETLNLISEEVEELKEDNFEEEENLAADKMEENVYKEHLKRL